MSVINRRDVFRSSGLAVAATLANSVIPARAFAELSAPSSSPMVSTDLVTYLTNQAVPLAAKRIKGGSLSSSEYSMLAGQQRLLAHHIESIPGYDDQVKGAVSQALASGGFEGVDIQSVLKAAVNDALPRFKQVDSSITSDQLYKEVPILSIAQLNSGLAFLANNGISAHFHNFADQYIYMSHTGGAILANNGSSAHLHNVADQYMSHTGGVILAKSPLYAKQSHGHIVRVGGQCVHPSPPMTYGQCVAMVYASVALVTVVVCYASKICGAILAAGVAAGLTGVNLLNTVINNAINQFCK